jgi:hypothetical protein
MKNLFYNYLKTCLLGFVFFLLSQDALAEIIPLNLPSNVFITGNLSFNNETGDILFSGSVAVVMGEIIIVTAAEINEITAQTANPVTIFSFNETQVFSGVLQTITKSSVITFRTKSNTNTNIAQFTLIIKKPTPCSPDITPPVFTNCPAYINGRSIFIEKDSIPFFDLPTPIATDNCTEKPNIKIIAGLKAYVKDTARVTYEAVDGSGNKSICTVLFRIFRRKCLSGQTCIVIPPTTNASNYIAVTSSSGATGLPKEDTVIVSKHGATLCLNKTETFSFQVFLADTLGLNGNYAASQRYLIAPCTPCDSDTIPPKITGCPNNLNIETPTNGCTTATWANPTATDNCGTSSLSSNYTSKYCFPVGTTTVIYTAKDPLSNTTTCQFNVTVRVAQQQICKSYDVTNTNNVCGCDALKWQPYGFYLDGIGTCPADFFKPDGVFRFQMNADSTATLKGNFRNNRTWELVVADITLSGRTSIPPTGSPNLLFCQQGRPNTITNGWQYFTGMRGTFKIDFKILTVNLLGAAFQIGVGANNQNVDKMGASGRFSLSDGKTGSFGLILDNELTFDCGGAPTTSSNDIAVSIQPSSPTYERFATVNYRITAKNMGTATMQNAVIEFRFPAGTTNGGVATPSVGKWDEWCAGNVQCFRWTIPALSIGQEAVLNVPVFVFDVNIPIVATAKLLGTSPTDGNASNDVATTTITRFGNPNPSGLAIKKTTQLIPIVIQKLAPNPTDGELLLELESIKKCEATLNFSTPMGQIIRSEKIEVVKGTNLIHLDVSAFAQGIYFVSLSTNATRNMPIKFVKI